MTRTDWTPEELDGCEVEWLVDLQFAGRTLRVSTAALTVRSSGSEFVYDAGILRRPMWSRSMSLFDLNPEAEKIALDLVVPLDVTGLCAEGHRLAFSPCAVSQVRVRNGRVVDAYEDRLVVLTGRATSARYGVRGYGTGPTTSTEVFLTVERPVWESPSVIPLPHQEVSADTWPTDEVDSTDLGIAYSIVLGKPGYDPLTAAGWITAGMVFWLRKLTSAHVAGVALGSIEATTVMFNTDDEPEGREVIVGETYTDNLAVIPARDALGTLLTVVDYEAHDYDTPSHADELPDSYSPAVADTTRVYIGFHDGGGTKKPGGGTYRGAGDVLTYMLTRSGLQVDYGAVTACTDELNNYLIDTFVDARIGPMEWLTTYLLPLLPITLVTTERGLAPLLWRHAARPEDAVLHIDVDADETIEIADTISEEELTDVVNTFSLRYGYSRRTSKYTRTARLGPAAIESTQHAVAQIVGTAVSSARAHRISLRAVEPGPDSAGWVILTLLTGVESYVEDATTKRIIVTISNASSSASIAALFAGGTVFLGSYLPADGVAPWVGVATPSVTTVLGDFGTRASALCATSQALLAQYDGGGPDAGIRRDDTESRVVYDHGTAARHLDWKAAAYALPPVRVELVGSVRAFASARLSAPVLLTSRRHAYTERLGTIEGIDTDGITTGLRIAFTEADRVKV